jgi:hypothetical protein
VDSRSRADEPEYARQLVELLPAAVFVIDEVGTIGFASRRAAELVGREASDLVGESVLGFVGADTAWAYAAAVAMATDYADTVMGPLRVTFVGDDGTPRTADLWATNHLDDPTIGGIVCIITPETTAMGLGEAVAAVAGREPLDEMAARVITALRGHPVVADAVVYHRVDETLRSVTPLTGALADLADPSGAIGPLCEQTLDQGARRLLGDLGDLPDDLRAAAHRAGYRALWIEPVDLQPEGAAVAALALWRPHEGTPSPNELNSVYQAASILALAFSLDVA